MSESLKHAPSRVPWPPILYLAAVAISAALGSAVPLPWFGPPLADILFAIGWLLAVVGIYLIAGAIRALHGADTTTHPTKAAAHLVTSGPYAFSRNPIYLGYTTIMVAIGFILGAVWFLIMAVIAAVATQKLAVEPEEKHLAHRFGKRYRDYQKKVRRWF